MDTQRIREKSLEAAKELGYPTNENLPLMEVVKQVRSVSEAADRLLALYAVVACSYGFPKDKAKKWLIREGLIDLLTLTEKAYLEAGSRGDLDTTKQWQVEAIWALAWCVGVHADLEFSDSCSDNFIQMLPDIAKDAATDSFRSGLQLRDKAEIASYTDLAYCLHWALRDAEIKGQKIPGKVPGNVVVERRHALEWMIGHDSWDEVTLDT